MAFDPDALIAKLGASEPAPAQPANDTPPGQLEPGNIDLDHRPIHRNPDGSMSTVRSASFGLDGKEVLLPTIAPDGSPLTDDQAVALYKKTGQHLGKFDTPDNATAYAQQLHESQAKKYLPIANGQQPAAAPAFDPDALIAKLGAPEASTPPPAPDRGKLDAAVRSAGNLFGLGPILAAGTDQFARRAANVGRMVVGKPTQETGTFEDSRKVYADAADQAQAQHPWLTALGAIPRTAAEMALTPATAAESALTRGGKAVVGALKNGALSGAGDAISHGRTNDIVHDAEVSAAAAGGTAGALGLAGKAIGKGASAVAKAQRWLKPTEAEATKAAQAWVAKDISGEIKSASTPTVRKQLADDAAAAGRLVLQDPALDTAVSAAESGNHDALQSAQGIVRDRLAESGKKLAPGWAAVDAALPKPLTSGDVIKPLEADISKLRATGKTTDGAEADAINSIVERLKTSKDWGGNRPIYNPEAKVRTGPLAGNTAQEAISYLEKQKTGDTALLSKIEPEIDRIRSAATTISVDPDHVVSSEQLQKLWSDEAGIAYGGQGGINGTVTFERKLDVASHLRTLRDDVLERAAAKAPDAVADLKSELKDYSALKRIEKVFDQRINHAKANASGASVPTETVKAIKEWKHSPVGKAVTVIPEALAAKKKEIDKAVARAAISPMSAVPATGVAATAAAEIAKLAAPARAALDAITTAAKGEAGSKVIAAIRAGVPRYLAMQAAQQQSSP